MWKKAFKKYGLLSQTKFYLLGPFLNTLTDILVSSKSGMFHLTIRDVLVLFNTSKEEQRKKNLILPLPIDYRNISLELLETNQ